MGPGSDAYSPSVMRQVSNLVNGLAILRRLMYRLRNRCGSLNALHR